MREGAMKQTVIKNPTWWRRRTGMERTLTMLSSIFFVVCVSLIVALAMVLVSQEKPEHMPNTPEAFSEVRVVSSNDDTKISNDLDTICLSNGCIHTASRILSKMNPNIDPCDDFYEFACGNFLEKTNIPDDKTSITAFSEIGDELQEQLRSMIEEPIREGESKPFVLAKNLYKACMNKTLIESRGLKPLHDLLRKLGGWPTLDGDKWNEEEFNWMESVFRFRRAGYSVDYFMDFSIGVDVKNSSLRRIDIDQASLGLRREYLVKGLDEKIVKAYYDYMVDIAVLLGADRDRASKELLESLQLEMRLANISLPSEKRRNASALYNPMSIKELQERFPSIPWMTYINTILPPAVQLTEDEIVIVDVPQFISDLEVVLQNTPKRTLANYVMWRAAAASVSYLNEDLRRRQLSYSTALSGQAEREARWKECIDITSGSLAISTGALYVRKYFDETSKNEALNMVADIRAEFRSILETLEWMDDETRRAALDKAASMTTHIAYPDELLDDKKLEEFYQTLEMDPNDYLGSILNLTMFGTNFSFSRLRQPLNKTEWLSHGRPAVVNAFYSAIENSIQFPAGILQGSFFASNRPKYMNYGAIGFVIGHEITHGFDDQGRQFDKEGNLVDWWANKTRLAFIDKAQCIIDQYSNFTDPEVNLHLNGVNTQGENIADNGGIKEAYYAYNNWVKRNAPEPKLPGLDYTPQQMFWISAASTWCSKYRPESMKLRITTGFHSPGRFRVLGPISNMEEFSKDFNCPLGSKMNPVHKCKVW